MAKRFNPRRSNRSQIQSRVDSTCRFVISRSARDDIKKVTLSMARIAAEKNNLPLEEIIKHLRKLGAAI